MEKNDTTKTPLVIERVFDAPVERVWQAWTTPEMVKKWWGPGTFSAPFAEIDFRVGGKYLYCMRGAAAPGAEIRDYWSTGIYKEIVPREKIVVLDSFSDEKGNIVPASYYGMNAGFPMEMKVTTIFEDVNDGKTKLTLRHVGFPTEEDLEGARMGWSTSLDKLAELVK